MGSFLRAAIKKVQGGPGYLSVINKKISAVWLSKVYTEKALDFPNAFMMFSCYRLDKKYNLRLLEWISMNIGSRR